MIVLSERKHLDSLETLMNSGPQNTTISGMIVDDVIAILDEEKNGDIPIDLISGDLKGMNLRRLTSRSTNF